MRIAICDDEKSEIIKIQNTIAELQGNYQVDTYQNGKALLEAVRKGAIYDIFFCDIYLDKENRERYYRFLEQNL